MKTAKKWDVAEPVGAGLHQPIRGPTSVFEVAGVVSNAEGPVLAAPLDLGQTRERTSGVGHVAADETVENPEHRHSVTYDEQGVVPVPIRKASTGRSETR